MKACCSGRPPGRCRRATDTAAGPGQALVQVRASAICRSDMSLYYGKPIVGGEATATGQIVPGHEPAGEVVAVGDGVTGRCARRPGRIYLGVGCGNCESCRGGYLFLCPPGNALASTSMAAMPTTSSCPPGTASRCPTRSVSRLVR